MTAQAAIRIEVLLKSKLTDRDLFPESLPSKGGAPAPRPREDLDHLGRT